MVTNFSWRGFIGGVFGEADFTFADFAGAVVFALAVFAVVDFTFADFAGAVVFALAVFAVAFVVFAGAILADTLPFASVVTNLFVATIFFVGADFDPRPFDFFAIVILSIFLFFIYYLFFAYR